MLIKSLTTLMMICSSLNFTSCICPNMSFFINIFVNTPIQANIICPYMILPSGTFNEIYDIYVNVSSKVFPTFLLN
uniref:Secreted protein n=1 Tax=Arundo donax TaxID=35708 RepID=A0A0A9FZG9_ARUDO